MDIKKVLVIFKTHLDVGYTDLAANVTKRYMDEFIPSAIHTARALKESGQDARFIWSTGAWLITEYLRTHEGGEKEDFCKAIEDGDIQWHGLPFTTHTEMMDAELFEYGISLARELNQKFGRKTIAAKMTDVPGHTKGIISYLKKAGIEFLHIGVNPACTVPEVPALFRWQNDNGDTINVMYQKDYGEFVRIENTDTALCFAHTGDNRGAQTPENVVELFASLKEKIPGAEIVAGDLNDLALVVRSIEDTLPVITEEIGDTWIHGISSDPKKASWFRGLERFYKQLPAEKDKEILARGLIMIPEHTWGLNGQLNLTDHEFFRRDIFEQKRKTEANFKFMESSWQEQREYLINAVEEMSSENRQKAQKIMDEAVRKPVITEGGRKIEPGEQISFAGYNLQFNRQGEIDYLKKDGRVIADRSHRLLSLCYEQFSDDDYKRFYNRYLRQDFNWAREDFTKIGMYYGVDCYRRYEPKSAEIFLFPDRIVVNYSFPEEAHSLFGCPEKFDAILTAEDNALQFDLAWFKKPANRIAEAIWAGFHPIAQGKTVKKLGQNIDPAKVVRNGQCRLHGTDFGVVYEDMAIETLDAATVALQEPSILNFCNDKPEDGDGIYFNLYNNVWATNFSMWYDEDARFRFLLKLL